MKLSTSLADVPTKSSGKQLLKVAVLGFGTVGSSVARILTQHPPAGLHLAKIYNRNVQRKKVDGLPADVQWTENIDDALGSDVDIIVEVVGGLSPAGDWIRVALKTGKSVVTANKQLIAHHGPELFELAHQNGVHLAFGASVAGGVPMEPATTYSARLKVAAFHFPTPWQKHKSWDSQKPIPLTMSTALTPAPSWRFWPASDCAAMYIPARLRPVRFLRSKPLISTMPGSCNVPFARFHGRNCNAIR